MKIRLKDIAETLKYHITHAGPSRKARRKESALARAKGETPHGKARMSPKNWTRNRHKRRRLQKARRAQSRTSKAPR